jgi:hypothetical protein
MGDSVRSSENQNADKSIGSKDCAHEVSDRNKDSREEIRL